VRHCRSFGQLYARACMYVARDETTKNNSNTVCILETFHTLVQFVIVVVTIAVVAAAVAVAAESVVLGQPLYKTCKLEPTVRGTLHKGL
jgi:hypothetical protein